MSGPNPIHEPDRTSKVAWRRIVEKYQQPSTTRAIWQLVNTFVPYALLWYLMYLTLEVSLWLTIPLAVLAGAFLVRVFIIFHDCGHGSYFKSRKANDIVGFLAGVLTFTPYNISSKMTNSPSDSRLSQLTAELRETSADRSVAARIHLRRSPLSSTRAHSHPIRDQSMA